MLKVALRALAIAFYSLLAAAMIVDARHEGGLPDDFPFLAKLRETRDRFAVPGGSAVAPSTEAGLPLVLGDAAPTSRSGVPQGAAEPARSLGASGEGAAVPPPRLPPGSTTVRVNRGLP